MKTESITLYFKQGKSDKVYKASLEEINGKYLVNFAFGRNGSTLKTGTKTQIPIAYEKAKKIYDKLVKEKSAKGYIPNNNNTQYVYTSSQTDTGIHCQLLNPVEQDDLTRLIDEDSWWAQEKKDGKRMLLQKAVGNKITAINRRGYSTGAPEVIIKTAQAIDRQFLIDGEVIEEVLYVFDLLALDGQDTKDKTYKERLALLENLNFSGAIEPVNTAKSSQEKQALYDQLKQSGSEGIVFKEHSSAYTAGRPNSGGNQLKFKFYDTASVIVSKVNDKRSVAMMVYDGSQEVAIGNVTIAVNKTIPAAGDVIEVRYLYAYKGGSLYQPTFLMQRTDVTKEECTIKQLKYKKED